MKDKLEQFISRNKTSFDNQEVSDNLWNKIEADLKPASAKKDYSWLWKIAAVIFIGATMMLLFDKYNKAETTQYAGYNQELIDVEIHYTQQIMLKKVELETYLTKEQKEEFLGDLNDLDKMYVMLKSDLGSNQNNEKLIAAMIRNLQLRIEILNKQLNILEQIKNTNQDETGIARVIQNKQSNGFKTILA